MNKLLYVMLFIGIMINIAFLSVAGASVCFVGMILVNISNKLTKIIELKDPKGKK